MAAPCSWLSLILVIRVMMTRMTLLILSEERLQLRIQRPIIQREEEHCCSAASDLPMPSRLRRLGLDRNRTVPPVK
jgi:hypothetical protein